MKGHRFPREVWENEFGELQDSSPLPVNLFLPSEPQPQNPQQPFGGKIGQPATLDTCFGVTPDQLDYSEEHFTERHIDDRDPLYGDRSKYRFYGGVGNRMAREPDTAKRLEIAKQAVIGLNRITFAMGGKYQAHPSANVVVVFGLPVVTLGPAATVDWVVGDIGKGLPHEGELTNVNTLILENDCKKVITSYPGLPRGAYNYSGSPPYYTSPGGFLWRFFGAP